MTQDPFARYIHDLAQKGEQEVFSTVPHHLDSFAAEINRLAGLGVIDPSKTYSLDDEHKVSPAEVRDACASFASFIRECKNNVPESAALRFSELEVFGHTAVQVADAIAKDAAAKGQATEIDAIATLVYDTSQVFSLMADAFDAGREATKARGLRSPQRTARH